MKRQILGISRAAQFSPNSQDRDAAIFAAVTSRLEHLGNRVDIVTEDLIPMTDLTDYDLVFSMARGRNVLSLLALAEQHGLKVVNSAKSLLQLSRDSIVKLFKQHSIAIPQASLFNTQQVLKNKTALGISYPFWIKRADACAQQKGDVSFISNNNDYEQTLQRFANNKIPQFIAEKHINGDIIKFYGVEGTPFFYYSYPTEGNGFSKFGLENANGVPSHYPFDADKLKSMADQAAFFTGMTVYGGDAIVTNKGEFFIIDFNDWPSFSTCRREAAKAIAQRINEYK